MKETHFVNPKLNNNCIICWNEKRVKALEGNHNYFIDKNDKENIKKICKKHLKIIKIVDYKNDRLNDKNEVEHFAPQTSDGTTYNYDPEIKVKITSVLIIKYLQYYYKIILLYIEVKKKCIYQIITIIQSI